MFYRLMDSARRERLCAGAASLLLFALVGAVLCLPRVEPPDAQPTAQIAQLDLHRLDREQLRAQEKTQLEEILNDPLTDARTYAQAQERLMALSRWALEEASIEEILELRGYDGALVQVYRDCASVLVRAETLSRQDAALICDLVSRETGLTGGAIQVIPIN